MIFIAFALEDLYIGAVGTGWEDESGENLAISQRKMNLGAA